jgi:hypothetical protein
MPVVKGGEALAELVLRHHLMGVLELRIGRPPQLQVDVNVLLEGKRRIQHRLDALHAMGLDGLLDLPRMIGGVLDDALAHLLLTAPEQEIIAREVGVPEHVAGHQDVLGQAIAGGEIGMPGVAGEHHLEEARVPHVPLDELIDVAHAKGPVRHAHRQPIDGDLHHEGVGNGLEVHRVEQQP